MENGKLAYSVYILTKRKEIIIMSKKLLIMIPGHAFTTGDPYPICTRQDGFSNLFDKVTTLSYKGTKDGASIVQQTAEIVKLIRETAKGYDEVVLMGNSAGGYHAVMAAKDILFANKFKKAANRTNITKIVGISSAAIPSLAVSYVLKNTPIFAIHAENDTTVPVAMARAFAAAVSSTILMTDSGLGHNTMGIIDKYVKEIREFMERG